jgi:hypothetical protein
MAEVLKDQKFNLNQINSGETIKDQMIKIEQTLKNFKQIQVQLDDVVLFSEAKDLQPYLDNLAE